MGAPDRGIIRGQQVFIKDDGIYFSPDRNEALGDWRILNGPNGPRWERAATADFGTTTTYQEFNATDGLISTPQGSRASHTTVTANYTAVVGDFAIECNAAAGAFTVTLLPAATAGAGFILNIGKSDNTSNAVTIDGNASETINGNTTHVLDMPYSGVTLECNGTSWRITANHGGEGGVRGTYKNVTANYTATINDNYIAVNATSGAVTITLMAAATAKAGFILGMCKNDTSANAVTIDGNASETIGGSVTQVLRLPFEGIVIQCDGTNWIINSRVPGMPHILPITTPFEATVANATTSVVVNHNMGFTPHASELHVMPTNNLGAASHWWVSTITSTSFTINVDADPGAGTATFAWKMLH